MYFFFFNVYWCLACVCVHHNMCVWCQKRESDSQEMELQTDVSCHMGSGNHNWVPWQSSHLASPTSFPGIESVKRALQLARKPPESVPSCLHTLDDEDSHHAGFSDVGLGTEFMSWGVSGWPMWRVSPTHPFLKQDLDQFPGLAQNILLPQLPCARITGVYHHTPLPSKDF